MRNKFSKKFGPFSALFDKSGKNSAPDFPGPIKFFSALFELFGRNFCPLATLMNHWTQGYCLTKKQRNISILLNINICLLLLLTYYTRKDVNIKYSISIFCPCFCNQLHVINGSQAAGARPPELGRRNQATGTGPPESGHRNWAAGIRPLGRKVVIVENSIQCAIDINRLIT
jgi:hypothetical protein